MKYSVFNPETATVIDNEQDKDRTGWWYGTGQDRIVSPYLITTLAYN